MGRFWHAFKNAHKIGFLGWLAMIPGMIAGTQVIQHYVDILFIWAVYGYDACFVRHLRVTNWKQGILSNGENISAGDNQIRMFMEFITCGIWFLVLATLISLIRVELLNRGRTKTL